MRRASTIRALGGAVELGDEVGGRSTWSCRSSAEPRRPASARPASASAHLAARRRRASGPSHRSMISASATVSSGRMPCPLAVGDLAPFAHRPQHQHGDDRHPAGAHDRAPAKMPSPLASEQSPSHWRSTSAKPISPPARPPSRMRHEGEHPGRRRMGSPTTGASARARTLGAESYVRGRRAVCVSRAVRVAVAVVPTYNEAGNIEILLRADPSRRAAIEIVVVDDASPDGTAELARELGEAARRHPGARAPATSGPRCRLPRRVRAGDRDGRRDLRADRRRPVARPGRAAGTGRQHRARRRPGDRQPLRAGRHHRGLAVAAARAVAVGQPLRRRRARAGGQRRHRRASAPTR